MSVHPAQTRCSARSSSAWMASTELAAMALWMAWGLPPRPPSPVPQRPDRPNPPETLPRRGLAHAVAEVVDEREHHVGAPRADEVLGALELGLDGVDRVGGDGALDGLGAAAPARERRAREARQRQPDGERPGQDRDDQL